MLPTFSPIGVSCIEIGEDRTEGGKTPSRNDSKKVGNSGNTPPKGSLSRRDETGNPVTRACYQPPNGLVTLVTGPEPLGISEIDPKTGAGPLTYPVLWWADLPIASTIVARGRLNAALPPVVFTACRRRYAAALEAHEAAWSPREYEAALLAAAHGLADADTFRRWCRRKAADPSWRLDARVATSGRSGLEHDRGRSWWSGADGGRGAWMAHGWTWERLLAALELEVVDVVVEGAAAAGEERAA